jgi:plasmid stabilization system protein ParE
MTLEVVWSAQARSQLIATLTYISKDDPPTADLFLKRVDKSLRLLADAPDMGVPTPVSGVRTYAVPKTGHSFD